MSPERQKYAREYAAKRRQKRWAERAMQSDRCPASLGNKKPCRARLENRTVNGRTVPFCPQCDLKRRGICIDCKAAPVRGAVGKALRCEACAKLERGAAETRWRQRYPGKVKAQWKARKRRLQTTPGAYEAQLARKKLWRLARPMLVREYKKAWSKTPHAVEYFRAYRKKYRAERLAREKARGIARRNGDVFTHPCVTCGAALTGRPKKCATCCQTARRRARAILLAEAVA